VSTLKDDTVLLFAALASDVVLREGGIRAN
jgi:hypothetical protein